MTDFREWKPAESGVSPDDWDGTSVFLWAGGKWMPIETVDWDCRCKYLYSPVQPDCPTPIEEATYEPDLLAKCRALPKDQQEALIAALQEPVRDWADILVQSVKDTPCDIEAAAYVRNWCRPNNFEISDEAIAATWSRMLRANGPEQLHKIFREVLA